ncbi:MAG: FAD-dependent oxidoreductase [Gemmatimonadaceae bacterium]
MAKFRRRCRAIRRCDVAIIGAGITGALVADALTERELPVIAIDRRHPGHGSTSASTALLQYEIDTHLVDLIETIGHDRAVDAYRANLDAVLTIERLAAGLFRVSRWRRRMPGRECLRN